MTAEPHPALVARTENVFVAYRTAGETVTALHDVTVAIDVGSTTALCGPSGSGKSTMLRLFGLFEQADAGSIWIAGRQVDGLGQGTRRRLRRRTIAFVHQRPLSNLVSDLRVVEHLTFARQVRGLARQDPRVVLERFGLVRVARSWPSELSGGEQQRLAFAMAVASEPQLILADEPTAELDRHHAHEVIDTIAQLESTGVSTIIASHDPAVVAAASRAIELRDGRLVTG